MVFPSTHVLLTFNWNTALGERGQTGLRIMQSDLPSLAELNLVHGAFALFWGSPQARVNAEFAYTGVKAAVVQEDGTYPPDSEPLYSTGAAEYGDITSGTRYPLQVASVATLTTSLARGLASKGRMFLPPIAGIVDASTFRWNATFCQERATSLANIIPTINDTLTGYAVVLSRVGVGAQAPITGVSVGNRADVQRSRDQQVPETYYSAALP